MSYNRLFLIRYITFEMNYLLLISNLNSLKLLDKLLIFIQKLNIKSSFILSPLTSDFENLIVHQSLMPW